MKKILVIGGGIAAQRYVESLFWSNDVQVAMCGFSIANKTKEICSNFGLDYIEFDALTLEYLISVDCVILAIPIDVKKLITDTLLNKYNYRNTLILEKPLCTNWEDLEFYRDNLPKLEKCAVVCQRDFDMTNYKIPWASEYYLKFPSISSDELFNLIHNMPHILSWLFSAWGEVPSLKRICSNQWSGSITNKPVTIEMIINDDLPYAQINHDFYPNVQYRKLNSIIVKEVMNFSKEETELNLVKALVVSESLIKILKEIKED